MSPQKSPFFVNHRWAKNGDIRILTQMKIRYLALVIYLHLTHGQQLTCSSLNIVGLLQGNQYLPTSSDPPSETVERRATHSKQTSREVLETSPVLLFSLMATFFKTVTFTRPYVSMVILRRCAVSLLCKIVLEN